MISQRNPDRYEQNHLSDLPDMYLSHVFTNLDQNDILDVL